MFLSLSNAQKLLCNKQYIKHKFQNIFRYYIQATEVPNDIGLKLFLKRLSRQNKKIGNKNLNFLTLTADILDHSFALKSSSQPWLLVPLGVRKSQILEKNFNQGLLIVFYELHFVAKFRLSKKKFINVLAKQETDFVE